MKYLLFATLLIVSCATGPEYWRAGPNDDIEIRHPSVGTLVIKQFTNYELWPPDSLRIKPYVRAVYGEDPSIKLVEVEYWPFSWPCGLAFWNLQPSTIEIDFGGHSTTSRIDLYSGFIRPGYYVITLGLWESVPDSMNVLGLTIGEETNYFIRHNSCFFTETSLE